MSRVAKIVSEMIRQESEEAPFEATFALARLQDRICRRDWGPLEASETRELRREIQEKNQRILDLEVERIRLETGIETLSKVKPEVLSTPEVLRKIADALQVDQEECGFNWRLARDWYE